MDTVTPANPDATAFVVIRDDEPVVFVDLDLFILDMAPAINGASVSAVTDAERAYARGQSDMLTHMSEALSVLHFERTVAI